MLILLLVLSEDQVSIRLRGTAHTTLLGGGRQWTRQRAVRVVILNRWYSLVTWHPNRLTILVGSALRCKPYRLGLVKRAWE